MSFLPCSFPSCCENPNDVDSCAHEDDRSTQRRLVRSVSDDADGDDDISKLAVPEFKMLCLAHGVAVGGRKEDLIARLVPYLEGVSALMSDGEDINESDAVDVDA